MAIIGMRAQIGQLDSRDVVFLDDLRPARPKAKFAYSTLLLQKQEGTTELRLEKLTAVRRAPTLSYMKRRSQTLARSVFLLILFFGLSLVCQAVQLTGRLVANCKTPGVARRLNFLGSKLLVADGPSGLQVIETADLDHLRLIGSLATSGNAVDLVRSDNIVYLASGAAGIEAIDVSDLSSPRKIGGYVGLKNAIKVALYGELLLALDSAADIYLLDVRNPAQCSLITRYPGNPPRTFESMSVVDHYALISETGNGTHILDLSDPTNLPEVAKWNVESRSEIKIFGKFGLFSVAMEARMGVADFSNPSAPVKVWSGDMVPIWGSDIFDHYAVLAKGTYDNGPYFMGLQFCDLADPAHPKMIGSFPTTGIPADVKLRGSLAFTAAGASGVEAIEITPYNPQQIGGALINGAAFGTPKMQTHKGHLYFLNGYGRVDAFDFSNPSAVRQFAGFSAGTGITDFDFIGDLCVAAFGGGVVRYDVSNFPVMTWAEYTFLPNGASNLVISGQSAFVVGTNGALQCVRMTDPLNPVVMGALPAIGPLPMAVRGNLLYFADLSAVDVSDLSNPKWANGPPGTSTGSNLVFYDHFAYLSIRAFNPDYQISIYDLASPANPIKVGRFPGTNNLWNMTVAGSYGYAHSSLGLTVFDLSDPANPRAVGENPQGGDVLTEVAGRIITYTYAGLGTGNMGILNLFSPVQSPVALASPRREGELMKLSISGIPAVPVRVERSTNFLDWEPIIDTQLDYLPTELSDPVRQVPTFYRARLH